MEGNMILGDTILETRGLTREFKGFTAVNGVNLRVKRGSIHALIGPNGAGKTTCFNLLTKFLVPTAGQIVFDGIDITGERPAQVARRGIIRSFQISAVFPHLTALQNVRVGLQRQLGSAAQEWARLGRDAGLLYRSIDACAIRYAVFAWSADWTEVQPRPTSAAAGPRTPATARAHWTSISIASRKLARTRSRSPAAPARWV